MQTTDAAVAAQRHQLQAWVERRADDMAELLVRLVGVETENPPGRNLLACAQVLREAMHGLGLEAEVLPVPRTTSAVDPCIVRGRAGGGGPLVYFHGHFDVVPAQTREQFNAQRSGGQITGRGTADMKGGIVSMLYAAAAAQDLGLLGDGQIVIHLVCDEETGSTVGSGYLRENSLIDPSALAMLTAEQSGEVIWNAAKGALTLRMDIQGQPIHVGQAFKGVNSFLHMLKIAEPLGDYAQMMSERHTRYPIGDGEAPGSMVVVGGQSGGGSNFNVVPGHTWFTLDGRFNPEESVDSELARITDTINAAASAHGITASIEVTQRASPAATPIDHPAAELLAKCVSAVTAAAPRFQLCAGCLDTRWYSELGIPAFGYGPGTFHVSHGPHECVQEAALQRVSVVYALFAAQLLGGLEPRVARR